MRFALLIPALLAASPALAADYGSQTSAYYAGPQGWSGRSGNYEVRKYHMEDRRGYGGPGREYIRITPWPPQNVLYVRSPRGIARVVIDDRPPIWHPSYIPVLK
jgi:hypothetical protein